MRVVPLLALGVSLVHFAGALAAARLRTRASPVAALAFALACGAALVAALSRPAHDSGWVLVDGIGGTMLVLVTFLGLVVARFSETYLAGEAHRDRYAAALLSTLGAVSALVTSNHLVVIAMAWIAASLSLHRLLTFYRGRAAALVAAHKKFVLSRFADACVACAFAVFASTAQTFQVDALTRWASERGSLPVGMHVAMSLFALGVALKSAQLPFHGWLVQAMEAPTPVSALLHAGVVNVGGFLLVRLGTLLALAPAAQMFLVVVGTTTAVVAALVSATQSSVKVALAWSTSAQLGFMIVECALGAYDLALLHLVAHSLYKAHAFLSAGGAVDRWRLRERTSALAVAPGLGPLSVLAVTAIAFGADVGLASWVAVLSFLPLLRGSRGSLVRRLGRVALFTAAFVAAHAIARGLVVPVPTHDAVGVVIAALGFIALVLLDDMLRRGHRLVTVFRVHVQAGLYLDEAFTRLAFRVWPPKVAAPAMVVIPQEAP